MKKNKVKSIFYLQYQTEVKTIEKLLTAPLSFQNIHQLRIHLKIIRTFLLLFDEAAPGQLKIKKFRTFFNQVFKAAGKAREMKINHSLSKGTTASAGWKNAYKKYARNKIRKAKKKLGELRSDFDSALIRKADLKIQALCQTLSSSYILLQSKQFITKEIHQIRSIPEKNGDKGFHELRKHLKAIYAVALLLCKMHPTSRLKNELKQLRTTEQAIGKWHDNIMFDISWTHFKPDGNGKTSRKMTLSQHLSKSNAGTRQHLLSRLEHILKDLPLEVMKTHR